METGGCSEKMVAVLFWHSEMVFSNGVWVLGPEHWP